MENDLPKHQQANPYNYTKVQLAKRKKAIKDMIRDYPNVSPMWCEWMYDIVENTPPEEIEEIINKGLWEIPSEKFNKAPGGVLNTVECFNEDWTPYQFPPLNKIELTAE